MELRLTRFHFGKDFTLGKLTYQDKAWFIIEDKDRELKQNDTLEKIKSVKVHANTAIPYGKYQVIINRSQRFKINLPLLLNVPNWEGVRMHVGNYSTDTEGCLLPGKGYSIEKKMVTNSRIAFGEVYELIENALNKKETVWLNIVKEINV